MPTDEGTVEDALLADAVLVLALHWGDYATAGDPTVEGAIDRLTAHAPDWSGTRNDLMAWYFVSLAFKTVRPDGGNEWYERLRAELAGAAVNELEGEEIIRASWSGSDYWSRRFGPVYTTAMASILEVHCTASADE